MKVLIRKLQTEWPAWLAVSFIALLPARRLSEIPLMIFAIMMPFLLRSETHGERTRQLFRWILPLFLCFWLPMVFSSFDSYDAQKSWGSSLAAIRFLLAAVSMAVLLHPAPLRWKVLKWSALLMLFWALDGYFQLIFGFDVFGIPAHEDRLNALFFKKYQFYGPIMAMLSPLLLEYARRRWPAWAWAASFALIMGAVMIAGMRSGWVAIAMVLVVYSFLMLRTENRQLRKTTLAIPLVAVGMILLTYFISPLFQERVKTTLAITQGTEQALDQASSLRVPIFRNSIRMFEAHPVNGVGVRAFPIAYLEFADEDDPHVAAFDGKRGARHAHNIVLEVMADTGTLGLLGLLAGAFLAVRYWRGMSPVEKQDALPYAIALLLVLFPLNTHFSMYGTFASSLVWFLFGLFASPKALENRPR